MKRLALLVLPLIFFGNTVRSVTSDILATSPADMVVIGEVTPHAPYDGWETFVFQGRPCMAVMYDFPADQLRVCGTRSILGERATVRTTWDSTGTAAGVHIYVDGVEQDKLVMSDTLSQFPRSAAPLSIGYRWGQDGLRFQGTIYSVTHT